MADPSACCQAGDRASCRSAASWARAASSSMPACWRARFARRADGSARSVLRHLVAEPGRGRPPRALPAVAVAAVVDALHRARTGRARGGGSCSSTGVAPTTAAHSLAVCGPNAMRWPKIRYRTGLASARSARTSVTWRRRSVGMSRGSGLYVKDFLHNASAAVQIVKDFLHNARHAGQAAGDGALRYRRRRDARGPLPPPRSSGRRPPTPASATRMGRYLAWLDAERGLGPRDLRRRLALVGRRAGRVLAVDLGPLRRPVGHAAGPGPGRRRGCRAPVVPGRRRSTTPSTPCRCPAVRRTTSWSSGGRRPASPSS